MDPKAASVLACLVALAACSEKADITSDPAAETSDGGPAPASATDARARADSSSRRNDASVPTNSCARASVALTRQIPTVQVVVDASGSMAEPLGDCATRWDCLRTALIGDDGLITKLQRTVSFGLTLFGGQIAKIEGGKVVEVVNPTCPRILNVEPSLQNRDNIAMRYEVANPGGGTPTAEALQFVIDGTPSPNEAIETSVGPQIILLVTDGDPNECSDPVATTYAPTEAQAERAAKKGIKLFALTVASDQNREHLQRMANLGAGLPANASPGAPYFEPSRADELSESLRRIVGDAVSCDVQLEGKVAVSSPGDECEGKVILNSTTLDCNGPDGWRLDGDRKVVLQGEACERFKFDPGVQLSADFPCELITLL